jgi:dienelactone hydrolase
MSAMRAVYTQMPRRRKPAGRLLALAAAAALAADPGAGSAAAEPRLERLTQPWPAAEAPWNAGEAVTFDSTSPFSPAEFALSPEKRTPTKAVATLFWPKGRHAPRSVPAVILLHGSGGVLPARELTYGAQLSKLGIAVLVVDAFASRRDLGTSFTERLINITESMMLADAYAGLDWLARRPEIDPARVVLAGFSYGAMATMYGMNATIARRLAPDGKRFAGHVAYYGPCIARFADPATTGAPLLMLYGTADDLIDPKRCAETAAELRRGGSAVEVVAYEGAPHQWDGGWGRRYIGRLLNPCDLEVEPDGTVRDRRTLIPMTGPNARRIILGLCVENRPYLIGSDEAVRLRSNRDFGAFLARVFQPARR